MSIHEYNPTEALDLLLRKLEAANTDLAFEVRAAIDAGKDIEEAEPVRSGRKKRRRYRKAVRLSEEEALMAAVAALQAYFVEQPLFVSSALDNARPAALDGLGEEAEDRGAKAGLRNVNAGRESEKLFEVELRPETQLTLGGEDTFRFRRASTSDLAAQLENVSDLRRLLTFEEE